MFLDASAIVAILARETDAEPLKKAIDVARRPLCVSPLVVYEASISLARAKLGPGAKRRPTPEEVRAAHRVVAAFIAVNGIEQIAITPEIADLAVEAAATYGKVVGRADLNFGDCFAYACAKARDLPLLYKGADFAATDSV